MKRFLNFVLGVALELLGLGFLSCHQTEFGVMFMIFGSILLLASDKGKKRRVSTSSYVPAQRYYSAMTNRTYASEAEKRHAEDIWAANAHYNPRF